MTKSEEEIEASTITTSAASGISAVGLALTWWCWKNGYPRVAAVFWTIAAIIGAAVGAASWSYSWLRRFERLSRWAGAVSVPVDDEGRVEWDALLERYDGRS